MYIILVFRWCLLYLFYINVLAYLRIDKDCRIKLLGPLTKLHIFFNFQNCGRFRCRGPWTSWLKELARTTNDYVFVAVDSICRLLLFLCVFLCAVKDELRFADLDSEFCSLQRFGLRTVQCRIACSHSWVWQCEVRACGCECDTASLTHTMQNNKVMQIQ